MAMEFVRGQSLESIIRCDGCLEAQMAARIMSQTLHALAHAHSMAVLHRDIKPANILVTGDGRVKVTDFGIARVLGASRMTRHGRIIGTLEYIAPERIRGDESDPRSDLYSAGVVLYEMLAGKLPFAAQTDFELIKAHLEQEPPVVGEVLGSASPADWDAIVRKAMAKSPGQRFQTAEEFRQAMPAVALAAQVGGRSTATVLKPTRLAEAAFPETEPQPEPQLEPDPSACQAEPVSEPAEVVRKMPAMALILSGAGVLAAALALAIVLHIRTSDAAKKEALQRVEPTKVVTPAPPPLLPEPQKPDDSLRNNKAVTDIPAGSFKTDESTPAKSSSAGRKDLRDERRKAALRALEDKEPDAKTSKRAEALKALNH